MEVNRAPNSAPMYLIVRTYNMKTEEKTHEREVNYKSNKHRVWLASHMLWAFNNGHGVQIANVKDD